MSLQIIKSLNGDIEYVLLPMHAYEILKPQIDKVIDGEYEIFSVEDYVKNPAALARINANLTQEELAVRMGVSQAYISKIESKDHVSEKTLKKVLEACGQ